MIGQGYGTVMHQRLLIYEASQDQRNSYSGAMIATVASSAGRGILGCYISPYVSFKTDAAIATALHALLARDQQALPRRLYYTWSIEGHFNDQGEFVYCLRIPGLVHYRYWGRRHFDRDFLVIASMVAQIDYRVPLARRSPRNLTPGVSFMKSLRTIFGAHIAGCGSYWPVLD